MAREKEKASTGDFCAKGTQEVFVFLFATFR